MNKLSIALIFLTSFFYTTVYSQNYMDKILEETCNCVKNIKDTTDKEKYQIAVGFCMINAASPYQKQIKKEYKVDMENIDTEGEKLGKVIGIKMAGYCPDVMQKLTTMFHTVDKSSQTSNSIKGIVTKIENETFVIIHLTDEGGKAQKFYWLTFVKSESDIIATYKNLLGKSVNIDYEKAEYFDPNIGEYRLYNVIKRIN